VSHDDSSVHVHGSVSPCQRSRIQIPLTDDL